MKAILLSLALIAATGAPAMADGFPNPYKTTMPR